MGRILRKPAVTDAKVLTFAKLASPSVRLFCLKYTTACGRHKIYRQFLDRRSRHMITDCADQQTHPPGYTGQTLTVQAAHSGRCH